MSQDRTLRTYFENICIMFQLRDAERFVSFTAIFKIILFDSNFLFKMTLFQIIGLFK